MSNKLQISVQKHEFCNYALIFLLFSPSSLKHCWNEIVFPNLFRDLPVDLKTEAMQMKLRRVMCGDERFSLVGRCCHVTCPLLSYWTHKVISWLTQNKAAPTDTQLLICKSVFHTSILLINSTEISSLILKIIVRDSKVMYWLHSNVLYIFISGIYYAGNYTPPVRWHSELSRFNSCLLLLYKRIRCFQTGLPVDNCWMIACLRNIARFLRRCVYSLLMKIVRINNELL